MANEKDNEPVGPDSFGGEDYPSGEMFPLSPRDPEWEPPTVVPPIDPIEAAFVRVEQGLTLVKKDRDRLEHNLDVLMKDMRGLRTSIEQRFVSIETRLTNAENNIAAINNAASGMHNNPV
jgi:hypothetical protein